MKFIANLEDHLSEVMDVPSKAMTGYSASSPDEVGKMKLRYLFTKDFQDTLRNCWMGQFHQNITR